MKTTQDLLLERYHTLMGREAGLHGAAKQTIFASFRRTLGRWLPARRDAAILDVGCGEGAFLVFLKEMGYSNLAGCDLSPENVALCQQRGLDFVVRHDARDLAQLPGPAGGWDAIFCLDVLEHVPKQDAARLLADLRARLSPTGYLVLQTANMAYVCASWLRYNDITHEAGYTESTLVSLLTAAGFEEIVLRPAWNATTLAGRLREAYLALLHRALYLAEGRHAPRIPTKDLLARAAPLAAAQQAPRRGGSR
jgi:2-polyprenyl-3-methyl-5-hydroxy-6-metoxy-1,4-benzoquinol methylase